MNSAANLTLIKNSRFQAGLLHGLHLYKVREMGIDVMWHHRSADDADKEGI